MKNICLNIILGLSLFSLNSCYTPKANKELSDKIAQMLMVGFRDTVIGSESHIVRDIQQYGIGGVVIYEYDGPSKSRPRNINSKEQLIQLNTDLQSLTDRPLFIGIDEEGGRVSRLKRRYGFKRTKVPQYLGELNSTDSTLKYAGQIAAACNEVGVNINFAPLVDVNVNKVSPVIGSLGRSFSSNIDTVVSVAESFVKAHHSQNVYCSLKHFPGHGSAKADSHKGFTDVSNTWTEKELEPYQRMINDSLCPMVMTAHVFNRNLDPIYPATLSKPTLDILRRDMNYDGLIISDDMMMMAITRHFGLEEALEKAINAGVDVLIFSNNIDHYNADIVPEVIETVIELVRDGKVLETRIDESYNRIMKVKQTLN